MKRWGNFAGSFFAILIMFVVLYHYGGDLQNARWTTTDGLSSLVAAVAIYVAVVLLGALSWRILLRAFSTRPPRWSAERHLLISQIGKYIPGNVAQYLGRAAMTINSGVAKRTVGLALITETAVIVCGGFLAVAASLAFSPDISDTMRQAFPDASRPIWLGAAILLFFFLVVAATLASARLERFRSWPKVSLAGIGLATLLSTISFLLLGLSLHLIVRALSPAPTPMATSVAVFAVAWIAGFATPGAPGGLGVRESVLTLGLAPLVGGAAALSAALLYRGVSVLGDVIALGVGLLLPRHRDDQERAELVKRANRRV
jgi:glycosyltransferase 2 family protein